VVRFRRASTAFRKSLTYVCSTRDSPSHSQPPYVDLQFLDDYIEEAAKDPTCGCPELSGDQLNMFFKTYSPKFLFNLVKGFEGQQLGPLASCGNLKSADTSFVKINLPSSCTAERWNAGQGCQAALTRTEGDLKLVLRMEKCASHEFPFVELKCEGKDCDTILTPCTADSECSDATNFSCLEFASAADQCAQQSCAHAYSSFEVKADTGKCVAGAYNPDSPAGNCVLLGERYGPGFSYAYDADDKDRTKTPKRVSDISNCVMVMCNGSQWTDPMQNVPPSVCFTALTMRKPATGAQCSNAGEIVRNERWPFTSDNTCRWHEIDDAKEYELSHKVKPFAVGSSRYVSNSDDLLGQFFGYDAVDYIANPFGCRKSSDAVRSLVQLARKITDRHAGRAERTLSNSNAVGVCMPGQGYTLKAVESSSGFTRYDINALMGEPTEVLDSLFGVKCDLSCANSERFYSTGSATCTTQETADSTACLLCLNNTVAGNINAQCTCMTSALQCLAQKSSRWCESVFQSTEQLKQARDILSCSRPSSSSNCTVTCGKNAFVYSGAAYGDAQKFDGASARKVRSVNPITAGATVLAHADCSMSIALLPNHPVLGVELSVSGRARVPLWLPQRAPRRVQVPRPRSRRRRVDGRPVRCARVHVQQPALLHDLASFDAVDQPRRQVQGLWLARGRGPHRPPGDPQVVHV
jgi:hypothetical protein